MRYAVLAFSIGLIAYWSLSMGCSGDDDSSSMDTDSDTDSDADSDSDSDTDSDSDGEPEDYCDTDFDTDSPTPIPDTEHPGWTMAGCFKDGCHIEKKLPTNHPPGLVPGNCPACHMRNGAQDRPATSDHQDPYSGCTCHTQADLEESGHLPIDQFNTSAAVERCANCHPYCP